MMKIKNVILERDFQNDILLCNIKKGVFVKQLPGPFRCAPLTWGPLIPKLRGQFA